jgi:hypothetical protein
MEKEAADMRSVITLTLILFLTVSTDALRSNGLVSATVNQQNQDQHASPQEQQAPTFQQQNEVPPSSSTAVRVYTGCVVQSDHGYSLKTEKDTYPLDTTKDLSQYRNKQVSVTAILEHHKSSDITDLRLRVITKVIGDCNESQK